MNRKWIGALPLTIKLEWSVSYSTLQPVTRAGVSRIFETGWRRRFGPTWRARTSVTDSVCSSGAMRGLPRLRWSNAWTATPAIEPNVH
jgi:hypothetical protein